MSLDELIKQAQEKGLIHICPLGLRGKSEAVFGLLSVLTQTDSMDADSDWWQLHLWLVRN